MSKENENKELTDAQREAIKKILAFTKGNKDKGEAK